MLPTQCTGAARFAVHSSGPSCFNGVFKVQPCVLPQLILPCPSPGLCPAVAPVGGGRLHGALIRLSRLLLPSAAAVPPAASGPAGHAHYTAMTWALQAVLAAARLRPFSAAFSGRAICFSTHFPLFSSLPAYPYAGSQLTLLSVPCPLYTSHQHLDSVSR